MCRIIRVDVRNNAAELGRTFTRRSVESDMPEPTGVREPRPRSFFGPASFQPSDERMILVGIDMPFWSMVGLILKISLAAIPAMFILSLIWVVVVGTLGGILAVLSALFR
jgi:hypothetical protein